MRALRYAVRSDRGLVRGNNEDSVYAGPRLLAIADGMGGHAAGELASKIVISALEHLDEDRPVGDLLAALRASVERANRDLAATVADNPDLEGMGTTLTALRFVDSHVGLVHVGDSRAYLLRGDHLSQISHDDTYVQSLVDSGRITAEEATTHPRRSVILRALTGTDVDPDVSIREARVGDRYLLCSDGLSDVVTTATLFETLSKDDPQACADRLVDLALRGGGPDNVTCIVADVIESGTADDVDDVPVVAGAIVDPDEPTPTAGEDSSPAERAAQLTATPSTAPRPGQARPRSRWPGWVRVPLLVLLPLLIVTGVLFAVYAWTQRQYYVGQDGSEVAIFRGVDTDLGPLKFYKVAENTDLQLSDLKPSARTLVGNGITAASLAEARATVQRLRDQVLPDCASLAPSRSPGATASAGATPSAGASSSAGPSASASPSAGATPTPSAGVSPPPGGTSVPPSPVHTPEPGTDCK